MTYKDKLKTVLSEIKTEATLEQLIEELSELIQASAKRLRIMRGTNPTSRTIEENTENMQEEIADVQICIDLAIEAMSYNTADGQKQIELIKQQKLSRWLDCLDTMSEFSE